MNLTESEIATITPYLNGKLKGLAFDIQNTKDYIQNKLDDIAELQRIIIDKQAKLEKYEQLFEIYSKLIKQEL